MTDWADVDSFKDSFKKEKKKKHLTRWSGVYPGESDSTNDTFTEAQEERASLFPLQESLLFASAHEAHDQSVKTYKITLLKTDMKFRKITSSR